MIAKVNGNEISNEEVEREIENIIAQHQRSFTPEQIEAARPKIRQQAVESSINKYLLNEEVIKQNIEISPGQVDQALETITQRFPSKEAFEDQMKQVGVTIEQIKDDLSQQIKVDSLVRDYIQEMDLKVSEEDVEKFYNDNPKEFQMPERVQASHILLKVDKEASDSVRSQKRLELSGIIGQIEKGSDFANLAKQHSDCPSKEQGGDLGFFHRGKMVKPFEDVAFELQIGDVSDIVETDFGYHVIKLTDRKPEEKASLASVKDQVTQHLAATKEQEAFVQYVESLRSAATIEYGAEV